MYAMKAKLIRTHKAIKLKRFNIGHRTYRVTWQKELIDRKYVGLVNHTTHQIKLQEGRMQEDMTETTYHEIVHCAQSILGLNFSERTVMALGSLIAQAVITAK